MRLGKQKRHSTRSVEFPKVKEVVSLYKTPPLEWRTMSIKAYKYRLYPNTATIEKLQWVLDRARELYNAGLQERRDAYEMSVKRHPNYYDDETRKQLTREHAIGYYEQKRELVEIKEVRPEYQEIGSHVLQDVVLRVKRAYDNFFRRVQNGGKAGYPRFQGRNRYDSITYPDGAGWKVEGKILHLTKIGDIKIKLHRKIEGTIKTCTVKREGDQWYVVLSCEVEAETQKRTPYTDEAIGIDLGLLHFATLSTGDTIESPKYFRKSEKKLVAAQQSLARKKRGSHRRARAAKRVAKQHRKIRNQRTDFLHKQSRQLVNTYETIVVEDIAPANLSKRAKPKQDAETGQYLPNGASAKSGLNKSIVDAGWSTFITMCEYKAAWAGTVQMIRVDPKYTSQICSGCGVVKKKDLSERWHSCECGAELDRDHNAAINILKLGQQHLLGGTRPTLSKA